MSSNIFAFVLMPFDAKFSDIYKLGIQAVALENDIVAERIDEQTYSETILERIYKQIDTADFIIADMTGKNPNVFYEVGYAHARGKLVTLLTQSADDIPFDLKHHRHIIYCGSIQTLKNKLGGEMIWLKQKLAEQSKNILTVEIKLPVGELERSDFTTNADVNFTFDVKNKTQLKTVDVETVYFYTGKGWHFSQNGEACPSTPAEGDDMRTRHFVRSPIVRFSPGAWAQIRLKGKKQVWSRYSGKEEKTNYNLTGRVTFQLFTSNGVVSEEFHIAFDCEEMPF